MAMEVTRANNMLMISPTSSHLMLKHLWYFKLGSHLHITYNMPSRSNIYIYIYIYIYIKYNILSVYVGVTFRRNVSVLCTITNFWHTHVQVYSDLSNSGVIYSFSASNGQMLPYLMTKIHFQLKMCYFQL